jgi:hypothetical protein
MRQRWLVTLGIAAVLVAAIPSFALSQPSAPPRYTEHYKQGETAGDTSNSQSKGHETLWERITDDAVAFVTLCLTVVTGVLAVSTIGLWLVTGRSSARHSQDMEAQARLTREAIELSRSQFINTFRPRIVIHTVQFSRIETLAPNQHLWIVGFEYINTGETPAIIVELNAAIGFLSDETGKFRIGRL